MHSSVTRLAIFLVWAEGLSSSAGSLNFLLASYVSLAHTPAPSHHLDVEQHVHLIADQDLLQKLESPNCLEILLVFDPGVDTGSPTKLAFHFQRGLKGIWEPFKEYKQCCLRTFIVKVLIEALKTDKELVKHVIDTNDATTSVVHWRVSVWRSVGGIWE